MRQLVLLFSSARTQLDGTFLLRQQQTKQNENKRNSSDDASPRQEQIHSIQSAATPVRHASDTSDAEANVLVGDELDAKEGQHLLNLLFNIAEDQARKEGYIHRGITCNSCQASPICGIRYKCANCVDYDICERCEVRDDHNKTHLFIKIRIPMPPLTNPRAPCLKPLYPGEIKSKIILCDNLIALKYLLCCDFTHSFWAIPFNSRTPPPPYWRVFYEFTPLEKEDQSADTITPSEKWPLCLKIKGADWLTPLEITPTYPSLPPTIPAPSIRGLQLLNGMAQYTWQTCQLSWFCRESHDFLSFLMASRQDFQSHGFWEKSFLDLFMLNKMP